MADPPEQSKAQARDGAWPGAAADGGAAPAIRSEPDEADEAAGLAEGDSPGGDEAAADGDEAAQAAAESGWSDGDAARDESGESAEASGTAETGESAESEGMDADPGALADSAGAAAAGEFAESAWPAAPAAAPANPAWPATSTDPAWSADSAAPAWPADSGESAGAGESAGEGAGGFGGFGAEGVEEAEAAAEPETIGAYLGWHRRRRGVALEALAALTRIPTRSLQRLEAGAFDMQTDGYARSFVRTVAGAIGIDPDEAVLRMHTETWEDREPRLRGAVRVLIAIGALLASLLLGSMLWSWVASLLPEEGGGAPLPVRRDAVRALAEERGLISTPSVAPLRPDGALLPASLPRPPEARSAAPGASRSSRGARPAASRPSEARPAPPPRPPRASPRRASPPPASSPPPSRRASPPPAPTPPASESAPAAP